MSRDHFADLQGALDVVREHLPLLPTSPLTPLKSRLALKAALSKVRLAAEAYVHARRKDDRSSKTEAARKSDWIDNEGVQLWNLGLRAARSTPADASQDDLLILAFLKHASYKLVEAATDDDAVGPFLVRLLSLASKTVVAYLTAEDRNSASSLAEQASLHEGRLCTTAIPVDQADLKARAAALVAFYMARCDVAIADNNESLAFMMIQQARDMDPASALLAKELRVLAGKCWAVGNKLRQNTETLEEASAWLQAGLTRPAISPRLELSRPVLIPDDLARANALLDQLTELMNVEDLQQVHDIKLLQLNVLKQQKAPEGNVRQVMEELIQSTSWTSESVAEMLAEINTLHDLPEMSVSSLHGLLQAALAAHDGLGHEFVLRIVLAILMWTRKLHDGQFPLAHRACVRALDIVAASPGYEPTNRPEVVACQAMLWMIGDKCYAQKRFDHAAQWVALGAHIAFSPAGDSNFSKSRRKAASFLMDGGDYAAAQGFIDLCPVHEASSQYLAFLNAVQQGQESRAVAAVESIMRCADLDGKQLLLMATAAHDKGCNDALLKALDALLQALEQPHIATTVHIERLTLIRCLVRMAQVEIEKGRDITMLDKMILRYYHCSLTIMQQLRDEGRAEEHVKAIAWLYKTAYNMGVEGASIWDPQFVSDLFDFAAQLMAAYQEVAPIDQDPALQTQYATAMFACLSGKLFVCRDLEAGQEQDVLLQSLAAYLPDVREALANAPSTDAIQHMERTVDVFEVEILAKHAEWDQLAQAVEAVRQKPAVDALVLETIADILSGHSNCPTKLMSDTYEAIINAFNVTEPEDVARLARWIRSAVCIFLHRSNDEDEARAAQVVAHASGILKSDWQALYPKDEGEWLVATAWNRGLEQFAMQRGDGGQRWCELAIELCMSTTKSF
ncbi:sporulation-specific protein 22 [Cryptotrichosporon argae]